MVGQDQVTHRSATGADLALQGAQRQLVRSAHRAASRWFGAAIAAACRPLLVQGLHCAALLPALLPRPLARRLRRTWPAVLAGVPGRRQAAVEAGAVPRHEAALGRRSALSPERREAAAAEAAGALCTACAAAAVAATALAGAATPAIVGRLPQSLVRRRRSFRGAHLFAAATADAATQGACEGSESQDCGAVSSVEGDICWNCCTPAELPSQFSRLG